MYDSDLDSLTGEPRGGLHDDDDDWGEEEEEEVMVVDYRHQPELAPGSRWDSGLRSMPCPHICSRIVWTPWPPSGRHSMRNHDGCLRCDDHWLRYSSEIRR